MTHAHSEDEYLGALAGFKTVADAVADDTIAACLHHLWRDEIISTLTPPQDIDLEAYADALLVRFANTGIQHQLSQIAMDGSQKLPQRLRSTIEDRLSMGGTIDALLLAVAGWMSQTADLTDSDDPMADTLRKCHRDDPDQTVSNHLSQKAIFDPHLGSVIEKPLKKVFAHLRRYGIGSVLRSLGS